MGDYLIKIFNKFGMLFVQFRIGYFFYLELRI